MASRSLRMNTGVLPNSTCVRGSDFTIHSGEVHGRGARLPFDASRFRPWYASDALARAVEHGVERLQPFGRRAGGNAILERPLESHFEEYLRVVVMWS